jgi:hypothetical protein
LGYPKEPVHARRPVQRFVTRCLSARSCQLTFNGQSGGCPRLLIQHISSYFS